MKCLFQRISNLDEANKVVKHATLLLLILVGLQLLADLPTENKGVIWQNIIWGFIEICLISLLRWYRKSLFSFLLILMFLFTILLHINFLLSSSGGILTIIQYLFYIFICVRTWQATRVIQGESAFVSHFISNGYKWYFCIFLVAMVAVYIDICANNKAIAFDYIELPVSLVGVFGLFGYAFKRHIFNSWTWKIYLIFIIIWDIVGFFVYPHGQIVGESSLTGKIVTMIFLIGFILPYYTALYLYGYKSKHFWNKTAHNQTLNADSGNSSAAG
jgi:hypothetical protein